MSTGCADVINVGIQVGNTCRDKSFKSRDKSLAFEGVIAFILYNLVKLER